MRKYVLIGGSLLLAYMAGRYATPTAHSSMQRGDEVSITYPYGPLITGARGTGEPTQAMKTVNGVIYRTQEEPVDKPDGELLTITHKGQTYFVAGN